MKNPVQKTPKQKPRTPRHYTATERCEAVLAVWSEHRQPYQICQELDISWGTLFDWEIRALGGALDALAPKDQKEKQKHLPKLSQRLQKLIERTRMAKQAETMKQRTPQREATEKTEIAS